MQTEKNTPRVVVVGAGFAGIAVIKKLQKLHPRAEILLVSKTATFEYYPALYKLVTGALPIEVSVPIDVIFPKRRFEFRQATFTSLDQSRQVIVVQDAAGSSSEIVYDYLVLALGSETNFFNIKGLPELSYSFKSVDAALRLKRHFCDLFAQAKNLSKEELVSMLHIIIVGGGPSGVELGGDLRHYLTDLAKHSGVDPSFVTIDLIESGSRVLPTLPEKVSRIAEARLRKMGVNIFPNRALAAQEVEEVFLKDMQMNSHTVIWTAGTRINEAFTQIPGIALDERKRVVVSPYLTLPSDNHVFIAGDGAATPYSGLAQTAIDQGRYIGIAVDRMLRGKKVPAYVPKRPSFVIPIGNYWALFNHGSFLLKGFLPWVLRSVIDFRYFLQTVPLYYVFAVFKKGKKYRKVHGGCAIDDTPKTL